MNPFDVAAWALIVLAVIDWFATRELIRSALIVKEPALEERATVSTILTIAATAGAFLAAAYLAHIRLVAIFTSTLLIGALIALSLPQIIWWVAYKVGRFR